MTVTAKDLRFNISMLFDALSKGEDITITYRGKAKAKRQNSSLQMKYQKSLKRTLRLACGKTKKKMSTQW